MRVAVVGGGPSGSASALLLAQGGVDVTLLDDGRHPQLLVGESLVPAVVPLLRRLGVETETGELGMLKPGVSFHWSPEDSASFAFARFAPAVFPYAYNVPRPEFDQALLAKAVAAGVRRVAVRARLEPAASPPGSAELRFSAETLAAAPDLADRPPDLIVDASGRARLAARALGIAADAGPRNDVAHFAHFEGAVWRHEPGQVVITRLPCGWSWCIPLKHRLSIGIVVSRQDAARLGATPAERLERAIAAEPALAAIAGAARRATPVATYSNYQLVSRRAVGPGWVAVGDAFGFVDPMLSPGVYLGLRSAEVVADAVIPLGRGGRRASPAALVAALAPYERAQRGMLAAWTDLVAHLYDGRMLALMRAGREWLGAQPGPLKRAAQERIERHIALQASGMATTSRYSRGLLRLLGRHGLRGVDPSRLAIR